jgi:hypothetical protein
MAGTAAPPILARVIDWHWKWPVLIASVSFVVLLGSVFGVEALFEKRSVFAGDHGVLGAGRRVRVNIVLSFVSAFTLGAGLIGLAKAAHEFDRLRPSLRLGDRDWRVFRSRLVPSLRVLCSAGSIGGFVGASLDLLPILSGAAPLAQLGQVLLPFSNTLLFALLAMLALITLRQSQVFYEVGREHIELDLLDLDALAPFATLGLMNAAFWIIGARSHRSWWWRARQSSGSSLW